MIRRYPIPFVVAFALLAGAIAESTAFAAQPVHDITTLKGKVESLNGTAGLQVRFSALIEAEAEEPADTPAPSAPITPTFVLSSPLDGTSVQGPAVTVNQDTAGAPQNETAIVVDPNNPSRVVAAANDYVARTWQCTISGIPCSALGDGYSGTYYSNDGGATWASSSSGPGDLGTLIPGVTKLTGGPYDAGGDPALAFDSRGTVYYAGLGFNRASAPNTVAVNRGTFDGSGALTWSSPTFIGATTSPTILNDKEWIAADAHVSSPFRDRVYVSWTRFIFNPRTGAYVQSPIFFAFSSDGGHTFSAPVSIVGNVLYDQGSRPVVGPDGTVYVFFEGSTRLAALSSTYMVKSTDGGLTWSKPKAVSTLADVIPLRDTAFRVNSFPAADVAPNGDLYVAWSTEAPNDHSTFAGTVDCADWISGEDAVRDNCHSVAVYSKSSDGGKTWSDPLPIFPILDSSSRTAVGYPVTQPDSSTLNAPSPSPVESLWPAVAISPSGLVYMSAYVADVVSPWQTCLTPDAGSAGRINCMALGNYIDNGRLDYAVRDVTTNVTDIVSTHPINTRNGFGGGFMGDYTGLAVGSDDSFHALWTDTNNKQAVVWFYGYEFVPTLINQEDVVTASGSF